MTPKHQPVLLNEVLEYLDPQPGQTIIDATLGVGGHSNAIAQCGAKVIAIDQDPTMIALAQDRLKGLPVTVHHAGFDQLFELLAVEGIEQVDGLLADLGFCSDQMDDPSRGFSFRYNGPLDMRLDPTIGRTAAELINRESESSLADIFYQYGEERKSRRVAKKIVEQRTDKPFETTFVLAELVRKCVPRSGSIDPATRVFQALRIAVNDELGALERLLCLLPGIVKRDGRAAIISFHSLEDRLVKRAFRDGVTWQPLTKKPIEATAAEMANNPRARSAKLRVAQRIDPQ